MTSAPFITFEGGEGAGKSTQIALLASYLSDRSKSVLQTREPGGSPGAEAIRSLLVTGAVDRWDGVTEALLHYAARRDHLSKTIWPALERGEWVLCDRYADSTLAYQGYGHGFDKDAIAALYKITAGSFRPALTIILDVAPDEGLRRASARRGGEDRYERLDRAFHERVRAGFLEVARAEPQRCFVVDASAGVDAVHAMIRNAVAARLQV